MPTNGTDYDARNKSDTQLSPLLYSAAILLLLIAWYTAHNPFASNDIPLEEISFSQEILISGGLSWLLQWLAIICVFLGWFGWRDHREAMTFVILCSLTPGLIWWCGLVFMFQGMNALEAIVEIKAFEMKSGVGGSSLANESLFHVVGPILSPLHLHGPVDLLGTNFLFVLLSASLLVGYLFFVGRICQFESNIHSIRKYVKFVLLMLPIFLSPVIALVIRIAQFRSGAALTANLF